MKISVISPVKNEAEFIGYSIMQVLEHVHEFVYACAPSTDGTDELLEHIKAQYAGNKLRILRKPSYDWNPHDRRAYNASYNDCIEAATGDAVFFLHPDMLVTNPEAIAEMPKNPLAWYTHITSYAGDFQTVITKGRVTRWKNIHAKKFGLHYFGKYGDEVEDFYHKAITGTAYKHHGTAFNKYPFVVADSGLRVNHYCELKNYRRRLEKMTTCIKNLFPGINQMAAEELAAQHPRVTLESTTDKFGEFAFEKNEKAALPQVMQQYGEEFKGICSGKTSA